MKIKFFYLVSQILILLGAENLNQTNEEPDRELTQKSYGNYRGNKNVIILAPDGIDDYKKYVMESIFDCYEEVCQTNQNDLIRYNHHGHNERILLIKKSNINLLTPIFGLNVLVEGCNIGICPIGMEIRDIPMGCNENESPSTQNWYTPYYSHYFLNEPLEDIDYNQGAFDIKNLLHKYISIQSLSNCPLNEKLQLFGNNLDVLTFHDIHDKMIEMRLKTIDMIAIVLSPGIEATHLNQSLFQGLIKIYYQLVFKKLKSQIEALNYVIELVDKILVIYPFAEDLVDRYTAIENGWNRILSEEYIIETLNHTKEIGPIPVNQTTDKNTNIRDLRYIYRNVIFLKGLPFSQEFKDSKKEVETLLTKQWKTSLSFNFDTLTPSDFNFIYKELNFTYNVHQGQQTSMHYFAIILCVFITIIFYLLLTTNCARSLRLFITGSKSQPDYEINELGQYYQQNIKSKYRVNKYSFTLTSSSENLIGEGKFGKVEKGQIECRHPGMIATRSTPCAIKMIKLSKMSTISHRDSLSSSVAEPSSENTEQHVTEIKQFIDEAKIGLELLPHKNVMETIGIYVPDKFLFKKIERKPKKSVIMKYLKNNKFINRSQKFLATQKLFQIKTGNDTSKNTLLGTKGVDASFDNIPPCIFSKYMENGDLQSYLKNYRLSHSITVEVIIHYCLDLINGLMHLHNQQIIHRDIACRNCLIGADKKLKICDYGLSRQSLLQKIEIINNLTRENNLSNRTDVTSSSVFDYYDSWSYQSMDPEFRSKHNELLPIRGVAPEILHAMLSTNQAAIFTVQSDIWAYAVCVWEMYTRCQIIPYQSEKIAYDRVNNKPGNPVQFILDFLCSKKCRLSPPTRCPEIIYELLIRCWHPNPSKRPTTEEIKEALTVIRKHPEFYQITESFNQLPLSFSTERPLKNDVVKIDVFEENSVCGQTMMELQNLLESYESSDEIYIGSTKVPYRKAEESSIMYHKIETSFGKREHTYIIYERFDSAKENSRNRTQSNHSAEGTIIRCQPSIETEVLDEPGNVYDRVCVFVDQENSLADSSSNRSSLDH